MALPPEVVLVTFHGRFVDVATGSPLQGHIDFRVPLPITDSASKVVLVPGEPFRATLDLNGEFTIQLPATDTPTLSPVGWAYSIHVAVGRIRTQFSAQIPAATVGTLEYTSLVPVLPVSAMSAYLALAGGTLTGPLLLAADPVSASGAATKNYVDTRVISSGGAVPGTTITSAITFGIAPAVGTGVAFARLDHTHGTPPLGTAAGTAAAGNDSRLSDARTPLVHATSHATGGTDPITPASIGALPTSYVPPVTSVAGKGGAVTLLPADAGADPAGAASSAVGTHVGAADPHADRAYSIQRANHTGSQTSATISDFATAVATTALLKANNLSDLANTVTTRTNLGLGGAAVLNVGTATSTVAAGNDARILGAIQAATATTKGDLLAATGSAAVSRLGVGPDGQVLTASAAAATGLAWAPQASGGGPSFGLNPAMYGLVVVSHDPLNSQGNGPPGNNTIWGHRVWIPAGVPLAGLWVAVDGRGTWDAVTTGNSIGLYTDAGVLTDSIVANNNLWTGSGSAWCGGLLAAGTITGGTGRFVYILALSRGMTGLTFAFPASANDTHGGYASIPVGGGNRRSFYTSGSALPASFNPTTIGTASGYGMVAGAS